MSLRTIALSCLAFLAVVILVPRHQWVLRAQLDRLADRKVGDFVAKRHLDKETPETPGRDVLAMQSAKARDDWAEVERIANRDPQNERGLWTIAVRYALGRTLGRPEADIRTAVIGVARRGLVHLQRNQDRLFRELVRAVSYNWQRDSRAALDVISRLASELPADRPNLALPYDNGAIEESRQTLAYENATVGYRGEYVRMMIEAGGMFPELYLIRKTSQEALATANPKQRMDIALVGLQVCRTGTSWGELISGRMLVEDACRGAYKRDYYRDEQYRLQVRQWAKTLDQRLGGSEASKIALETEYAINPFDPLMEEFRLNYDDLEDPFEWGGRALVWVICIAIAGFAAARWQPLVDREGAVAAIPHLTAAVGWTLANMFMGGPSTWMLTLVALSHLAFAASMASDRAAKGLTGAFALVAAVLVAISPERLQALPGMAFFLGAAILPWTVERPARRRWGLLAGWAISAGCMIMAILSPESILPVVGWAVGLLCVRGTGAKHRWSSSTLSFLGLLTAGVVGVAVVAKYAHEPITGWIFAVVLSATLAMLPARVERKPLLTLIGIAFVLVTLAYAGSVGWSIRQNGQMALVRQQFATLAERLRSKAAAGAPNAPVQP